MNIDIELILVIFLLGVVTGLVVGVSLSRQPVHYS
jgi:hypothetical protein